MRPPEADADPSPGDVNQLSASRHLTELSGEERESIDEQSRPSATLIHETIRAEGESELERKAYALFLSGLAAGLSMGLSLIVQGLLQSRLPEAPWRELVSPLGYTAGFLVVVLGRQQLFTENTLTPMLPLLHNRDAHTLLRVARLWAVVLVANLLGAYCVALTVSQTGVFDPEVKRAFGEISAHTIGFGFWVTFLKAVFAGWLIALMVWLLPAAESSRPMVILLITYVVALGQFSHIIAGAIDAFYLTATGAAGWSDIAGRFFAPTLLGNIVGGVALVAVLNYGQVAPEIE
jgi:formate/nitrite transporter FocA (FNT family)